MSGVVKLKEKGMRNEEIVYVFRNSLQKLNSKTTEIKENKLNSLTKIHVGRAPSLASFFEKTFTEELSKIYPEYDFYIDYPGSLFDERKNKIGNQPIYPDIMIVDLKNKILKAIIEIKLDIGYVNIEAEKKSKRDGNLNKAVKIEFNSIVGAYSKKEQEINKRIILSIPKDLKKIVLVVTTKNQHSYQGKPKKESYEKILSERGYKIIFLLEKIHYNNIKDFSTEIENEFNTRKKSEIVEAFEGL